MSKRSILVPLAALAMIFGAGSAFANSLDVNPSAALAGNFGLEIITDGTSTPAYVATAAFDSETVVRAEWRANRNTLSMAAGTGHAMALFRRANPPGVLNNYRSFIKFINGEFKVTARAKKDGPGTANCGKTTFAPGGGVRIGFEIVTSSGPGNNDGLCRLYRNGVLVFENTGLDNDMQNIGSVRFGAPDGVAATTSGSFYLDDFSSFRTLGP